MLPDLDATAEFYATPRGVVAFGLVRERLLRTWPSLDRLSLMGLGYAAPYLPTWPGASCAIAAVTTPGAALWPARRPENTRLPACLTEEDALPFPDLSFDRILLVHALEAADNARALLREVWRVLKDDGRLLVVAPNRRGLWAHVESTPFGHGQPYSPGQIGRLLAGNLFRVERRDTALYVPPLPLPVPPATARAWEASGRWLLPQFAGVTITEAVKDVYAAIPLKQGSRRRVTIGHAA